MRNPKRLVAASALVLLFLAAGCSSRWQFVRERPTTTETTKVTVRTEPKGAEVNLNGTYLGPAPIRVPIMYKAEIKVYERREALPYLHVETKELKSYIRNVHKFTAIKTGYEHGEAEVTLLGEEEKEITITLHPKKR